MTKLPTVITSSVIRSAHQGESHGGVYLVDLNTGGFDQVIDWNDGTINWEGRGGDRGLRGIALYDDRVYLAASDELYILDRKSFKVLNSFKNRYLKHCHEIHRYGNSLYLTSTNFDSVLEFDLKNEVFVQGFCLRQRNPRTLSTLLKKLYVKYLVKRSVHIPSLPPFDPSRLKSLPTIKPFTFNPNSDGGPLPGSYFHLNSVNYLEGNILVSGLYTDSIWGMSKDKIVRVAPLPLGTHNTQPYNSGFIYNHTVDEKIAIQDMNGKVKTSFSIKRYPEEELLNSNLPKDHAAQSFGRGLIITPDGLIIGGSSPATISVYQIGCPEAIRSINLTMDVRNSIHGLALWRV